MTPLERLVPEKWQWKMNRPLNKDRHMYTYVLLVYIYILYHIVILKSGGSSYRNIKIWLRRARCRLYWSRIMQVNTHFATFIEMYKICTLLHRSKLNIFVILTMFSPKFRQIWLIIYHWAFSIFSSDFWVLSLLTQDIANIDKLLWNFGQLLANSWQTCCHI